MREEVYTSIIKAIKYAANRHQHTREFFVSELPEYIRERLVEDGYSITFHERKKTWAYAGSKYYLVRW